jgi:cobalt-zinc-cadmium efflux system membrane fusion protein
MSRKDPRWSTLFTAAAMAVLAGCGHRAADTPSAPVTTDSSVAITPEQRGQIHTETVGSKAFNPSVLTTGTVNFDGDRSTQVISSISGPVVRMLADLGDAVTPGKALATVASPDFAAAVSSFRKAEAAYRNAQRIETLDEKLFTSDALARAELDQAKSDLSSAAADREAGIQQLYSLGVDSTSVEAIRVGRSVPGGESAIRAPIAGVVVERLITVGQLLQAGTTPAFTIANLSEMWVIGSVFEGDVSSVRVGSPAMITLMDATADSFPGRVNYVGAEVDPDSKAAAVRIVVPNRGGLLRGNMLVRVEIRGTQPRNGIVIPVSSVLRDNDNLPFVYVDIGNNHFSRRRITLGGRTGNLYSVAGGLQVGENLVTQGALFLQEAGAQ